MGTQGGERYEDIRAALISWLVILGISAWVVAWGLFLFVMVGDKPWPPPWDYDVIPDVPGSSPYATAAPRPFPESAVPPFVGERGGVEKQHVKGQRRGPAIPRQGGQ